MKGRRADPSFFGYLRTLAEALKASSSKIDTLRERALRTDGRGLNIHDGGRHLEWKLPDGGSKLLLKQGSLTVRTLKHLGGSLGPPGSVRVAMFHPLHTRAEKVPEVWSNAGPGGNIRPVAKTIRHPPTVRSSRQSGPRTQSPGAGPSTGKDYSSAGNRAS